MTDYRSENDMDTTALWTKDPVPVFLSGVSRFRRWLFPALTAAAILILIIALGATSAKTSNGLWSMEQRVSNLSDIIQSLNSSLQLAEERAKEAQRLQFAVEKNKEQLTSVSEALKQLSMVDSLSRSVAALKCSLQRIINNMSEALKQLSMVDSLSRSVAALKCSLQRIINNSSAGDGCCPVGWVQSDFNCFFFSQTVLSWNESRVWCEKEGAHLLILHTDKEWDFVTGHTVPQLFWVGLSDWRTGRWEWINRTPYRIERRRWVPGQPDGWSGHGLGGGDEDCAHLHYNGRLNDLHCSTKLRYICQKHSTRG